MRRLQASTLLVTILVALSGCASAVGPSTTGTRGGDTQRATVIEVVDGDTLDVRMPDGTTDTVRLLGVDSPEVPSENQPSEFEGVPDSEPGTACLQDAGRNASAFVHEHALHVTVTLVFDPVADHRGSYGRLLEHVRLEGQDLNRQLVARGHARVYDGTFSGTGSYYDLEATAQTERRGLWGCWDPAGLVTPTGDGPLELVAIHADAPGDDRENPNGEYLVFENAANVTLDLSGWTLDDAAGNTYVFPDGFTPAPGARVTVYTGQGDDNATRRYWDANGTVWNNDGDTVIVRTANGTLVLERSYG